MSIIIKEVKSKTELKQFIRFGISMYKDSAFAAPPLLMDDLLNLSKGKNPALEFCEVIYLLAYRDGKIVGRIAGIINPVANEVWKQQCARFGWVDFLDDPAVTLALFNAVTRWARTKGMTHLQGPMGFTDFDREGALTEGYDKVGTLATIYNHPYYIQHYQELGFQPEAQWHEYLITVPEVFPERYIRMSEIVKQKQQLKVPVFKSKKELVSKYAKKIFYLLNASYSKLFNFSPLNDAQIDFYIKLYFSFFRLDTVVLVTNEQDDVVGLGIAMPSFTKALQKAKGRLFPLGWWYMLRALNKNDIIDLYLMAVHPDYQNKGVNAVIFAEMMPRAAAYGYRFAESNPELVMNTKMSSHWDAFEHVHHKSRVVFSKEV